MMINAHKRYFENVESIEESFSAWPANENPGHAFLKRRGCGSRWRVSIPITSD